MKTFMSVLAAAAILAVASAAANAPGQVHIAYAGNAAGRSDGMTVSWQTDSNTATSTVKYGTSPGQYTHTATGSEATYGFTVSHHVTFTGLEPGQKYYYVAGDEAGGWSAEASFVAAPAIGAKADPWSVAIYGDVSHTPLLPRNNWGVDNSKDTIALLNKNLDDQDFIWHVGDISYADDAFLADPLKFGYEERWNTYMQSMQSIASTKAYMTLPGNHEAECHSGFCQLDHSLAEKLHNFTAYNTRFRMPSAESGGVMNMWYSFNYKNVHFVNINTETDYPGAPTDSYLPFMPKNGGFGDQMTWLEADLKKAAAARAAGEVAWIFVAGHRPVYSVDDQSDGKPGGSASALQTAVEDLFNKYGVDWYFCGHVHSYERQWPTLHNVPQRTYVNPTAPAYVVSGAGGNIEGVTNYGDKTADWNVIKRSEWGYGVLTVSNETHLHWKFLNATNGALVDQVELIKTVRK